MEGQWVPSPLYLTPALLALNHNYEQLTLKYGLHADNITRWAFKNCPSALKMTSTKDSSSNSVSKTLNRVLLWLFHFRQYCCCSPPVDAIFGLFPVGSCLFLFVLEFFLNFSVYQVPAIQSRECLVCDYQVRLFSWSMASSLVAYMSTLGRTSEDRTALAGPPVPPNPRPLSCLQQPQLLHRPQNGSNVRTNQLSARHQYNGTAMGFAVYCNK